MMSSISNIKDLVPNEEENRKSKRYQTIMEVRRSVKTKRKMLANIVHAFIADDVVVDPNKHRKRHEQLELAME